MVGGIRCGFEAQARHKHAYELLMNSLCEKHNAFVLLAACLVGWVDWWRVYRDMEDVRDFESESFILGCLLPLPPLLSLHVLSFSLFHTTFCLSLASRLPRHLGCSILFSCCLAFLCHTLLSCVLFLCWRLCRSHMQTLSVSVCFSAQTSTSKAGFRKSSLCFLLQLLSL